MPTKIKERKACFGRVVRSITLGTFYVRLEKLRKRKYDGTKPEVMRTYGYIDISDAKREAIKWAKENGYHIIWKKYRPGLPYEM
jgi:hypothetical protein